MKYTFLLLMLLNGSIADAQRDPVIQTDFPDPTVILDKGTYYAYATNSGRNGAFCHIQVATSNDLKNWSVVGDALPVKPVWGDHDFWAPHVIYNNVLKKYVLFYSAETIDKASGKAIGVAFADKPEGPFTDMGKPLVTGPGFEAIDPMTMLDPHTGKYYMAWGSDSKPIKIRELDVSMKSFAKGSVAKDLIRAGADTDYGKLIEGAWIDYNEGYYYLYYSGNNCCNIDAHYAVMVARSKNIDGPYTRLGETSANKSSVILEQDAQIVAPGHNSVFTDKRGQKWIAYHAIPRQAFDQKKYGRIMYLNRMEYKSGWPIVMDNLSAKAQINWKDSVTVSEGYMKNDKGDSLPVYGAQYPRLLKLTENKWLAAYTVLANQGYRKDVNGGMELEIAASDDNGHSWYKISRIKDPGRDLDNAQMTRLPDGSILLAGRSVRWQESYRLPVYKSSDNGYTWHYLSTIDANEGKPGTLGKPDKGMYEPHFYFLKTGQLAVMYANEKHVTSKPSYSQVISQKISPDLGKTWGKEIWVAYEQGHPLSRPGMPVIDRMQNGDYLVVYEICGPEACSIYSKTSSDGVTWKPGLGQQIPEHKGAPYVLSTRQGSLILSSNSGNVSISNDFGKTWQLVAMPWKHSVSYDQDWTQTIWQGIYQFDEQTIGIITSRKKEEGGHNIKLRFGQVEKID